MDIQYTVDGRSLVLSEETDEAYRRWDSAGDETRRAVYVDARALADALGKSVEIYGPDGVRYEQVWPR